MTTSRGTSCYPDLTINVRATEENIEGIIEEDHRSGRTRGKKTRRATRTNATRDDDETGALTGFLDLDRLALSDREQHRLLALFGPRVPNTPDMRRRLVDLSRRIPLNGTNGTQHAKPSDVESALDAMLPDTSTRKPRKVGASA